MNSNTIGKTLVLFNLVLSVLFMTFALAIFTQQIDFGWKEPRQDLGERVPSEFDKRSAAITQLLKTRARVDSELQGAQAALGRVDQAWPRNHLDYVAELKRLESAPDKIEIKLPKRVGGLLKLDPNRPYQPSLEEPVPAEKSYKSYDEDYTKVLEDIKVVNASIVKLLEQQKDLTTKLNGIKDDATKQLIKPGLYVLLEREDARLKQLKKEIEYIRPLWVRELVDAQLLIERRLRLEQRLEELKNSKGKKVASVK